MKYFIGSDNSGHHYLIPVDCREKWEGFLELDEGDEASWQTPCWATRLNRHLSWVEFENPIEVDP